MAIRLERLRVQEALTARDVAVSRLAEACASVRDKTSEIIRLKEEKVVLERLSENKAFLTQKIEIDAVENKLASLKMSENRPPDATDGMDTYYKKENFDSVVKAGAKPHAQDMPAADILKDASNLIPGVLGASRLLGNPDIPETPWTPLEGDRVAVLPTATTTEKIQARYAILAALPLPQGIPQETLAPIIIPSPHTLHDFIGTTSALDRIGNYRVFQQMTTTWCPEREEHGYYLTPLFKCTTNPRVTTAHRWSVVDLTAKLDKPTECFFNKDGHWYYAGVYTSFRLEDLCPQEWECLSTETSQALIKETLAGRKNTSPQNVYETGQLYSAGALKIACIGLQCTGFNDALYRGLLEHAAHCAQTGKWRATAFGGGNTGLGFGAGAGAGWNVGSVNQSPGSVSATSGGPPTSTTGVAPGSPIASLGSPGKPFGRVPGLVPVAPSVRNVQPGSQDLSALPVGRAPGV
ncbi:hypothetical protein C8Q77DRAFT_1220668 [Trametes polyzona]|nr:hypothetical protein C8Q77DRAFT_1220668 [Trametes polyzona]